jgi:hypothetical protein
MAYDGYRNSSVNGEHYPPYHHSSFDSRDGSIGSFSQPPYESLPGQPQRTRSRASSVARSDTSQPQPIYAAAKAVNSAFDASSAASKVDPALIAQITEQVRRQVIESLKESGITASADDKQKSSSPPPPQTAIPKSPIGSTTTMPVRNVYTPESPVRSDHHEEPPQSPLQDSMFEGSKETPKPDKSRQPSNVSSQTIPDSPPKSRPPLAAREPTDGDATIVEKTWKPLFTSDGAPTPRLGQFLRGLAIHLVSFVFPSQDSHG